MPSSLAEFFTSFADNAHIGKIATDFFPGIVLTVTVLLMINNFTSLVVFPFTELSHYHDQTVKAEARLEHTRQRVEQFEDTLAQLESELPLLNPASDARQQKQVALLYTQKLLLREKNQLTEQEKAALQLRQEEQNARSLQHNSKVLIDHFMSLFLVGYLVGTMMAQVSGKIFYNGMFNTYLRRRYPSVFSLVHHDDHRTMTYHTLRIQNQAFLDRLPNITTEYYRYLEIAMNMILPVAALALTLAATGVSNLLDNSGGYLMLVLSLVFLLCAVALYANARVLYVGYFMKKADIMVLIQEEYARQTAALQSGE